MIGSLNEFAHAVRWALHDASDPSFLALSLRLARMPVNGPTIIVFRADRTLEQIRELYSANEQIWVVQKGKRLLKEGTAED